jgi:thioredoxin 1
MSAKNLPVILAGLILVGVVGVGAFFALNDSADASSSDTESSSSSVSEAQPTGTMSDTMSSESTNTQTSDTSVSSSVRVETANNGTYTDYSADLLSTEKTNVLFFKADWCTTCNSLERNINSNLEQIPGDVQILVVDYDSETSLKNQYNVRIQHTLVEVDADGNEIQKWVGSPTLDSILSNV